MECHASVHTESQSSSGWLKHPTVTRNATWRGGGLSRVKTLGQRISCVTCQQSSRLDALLRPRFDNRATAATEDGSSIMQNLPAVPRVRNIAPALARCVTQLNVA